LAKHEHSIALAAALWTAVLAIASPAMAERLDKPACDALRSEEDGLVQAGIKTDMEKGAEWAKANLSAERLNQIARFIELGEQIAFRCREIKAPPPTKTAKPTAAPGTDKAGAQAGTAAPAGAAAAAGKTNVKKVKPAAQAASATEPAADKPAAVIRVKPAAKPVARTVKKPAAPVKTPPAQQKTGLFNVE
jgi:hypothetical protein